jgi:HK97 family phage major capsid protein
VKVIQVSTTDYHILLNLRGATSGWSTETGTRGATSTMQFRDISLSSTFGELYAYPQVSNWALADLQFDVENFLAENVGDEFARQTGQVVLTGSGSSRPVGMLNTSPVTTADSASPVRAAAAYQYFASTASPFSVNAGDILVQLPYKLNSAYRQGAAWAMNSNTVGAVRSLKDTTNRYLWQPSLVAGTPDTLMGYPVYYLEDMDDIGASKLPVAFGNFQRGYVLADRVGMTIIRDQVTNPGYTRFLIFRRLGGSVLNNDAIKWIQTS